MMTIPMPILAAAVASAVVVIAATVGSVAFGSSSRNIARRRHCDGSVHSRTLTRLKFMKEKRCRPKTVRPRQI